MKRSSIISTAVWLTAVSILHADQTTASVQQSLKDEGFYYGAVDGNKNADTTAAIRRYQIRNGLKITGEADAETLKALGSTPTPQTPASVAPIPAATAAPPALDTADLRDATAKPTTTRVNPPPAQAYNPQRATAGTVLTPVPRGETGGVFAGTPYEIAPPELQRHVIIGAQTLLGRRGYYRGAPDGAWGRESDSAVRSFQTRNGIPANGQLDMDTLAALGLLPGQRAPGIAVPSRRVAPRPILRSAPPRVYRGEWVPE